VASLSGGDTRHWRYIEFGTESIAAQPFMRPALASNAERVAAAVMAELDKQLTKTDA
jgi:HK97 gp10 family phage protein